MPSRRRPREGSEDDIDEDEEINMASAGQDGQPP